MRDIASILGAGFPSPPGTVQNFGGRKKRATLAEILRNQFDSAEPSRNAFRV